MDDFLKKTSIVAYSRRSFEAMAPHVLTLAETEALVGNPEVFPARAAREQAMWQGWLQAVRDQLRLDEQTFSRHRTESTHATITAPSWEALLAIDHVARGLRLHRAPRKNQQRILAAVGKLVSAETLLWVASRPPHVCIDELLIKPTDQAAIHKVHRCCSNRIVDMYPIEKEHPKNDENTGDHANDKCAGNAHERTWSSDRDQSGQSTV